MTYFDRYEAALGLLQSSPLLHYRKRELIKLLRAKLLAPSWTCRACRESEVRRDTPDSTTYIHKLKLVAT